MGLGEWGSAVCYGERAAYAKMDSRVPTAMPGRAGQAMDIMDMDRDDPMPGSSPALADAGADGHGDGHGPWTVDCGDRQMGAAEVASPRPGLGPGTARGSSGPSQGKRKRYERDQRDERVATGGIVSFLILISRVAAVTILRLRLCLKSPQPLGLCVRWLPLSVRLHPPRRGFFAAILSIPLARLPPLSSLPRPRPRPRPRRPPIGLCFP
jgi:hypothetical protein